MEGWIMKMDTQLLRDVHDQLAWEPSVCDDEIGVAVKDGVVTLSGHVPSYADKYIAIYAVERVVGVKALADEIEVKLPSSHECTDTELAHAAVSVLQWNVQVPDDRVRVTVRGGWVTLEGEVEWQYQREAAERCLHTLKGVRGVTNLLAMKPKRVSAYDVAETIKDTLRRSADRAADRITVETHDGAVILKGMVRSFAERRDAERAAWNAPGVTKVDDHLIVGG
jgi:osmotically-inducible protein OsmY